MEIEYVLGILKIVAEELETKVNLLQSEKIHFKKRASFLAESQTYLTVNEVIVLLDIFRGTPRKDATFEQDTNVLVSKGLVVISNGEWRVSHEGDARVRFMKGETNV